MDTELRKAGDGRILSLPLWIVRVTRRSDPKSDLALFQADSSGLDLSRVGVNPPRDVCGSPETFIPEWIVERPGA